MSDSDDTDSDYIPNDSDTESDDSDIEPIDAAEIQWLINDYNTYFPIDAQGDTIMQPNQ